MAGTVEAAWQRPLEALPDELWDVVVVGAGPAGSVAALHLAAKGHRVVVAERARFPRHKVCGDGLTADAIRCLERAGLADRVHRIAHQATLASAYSASGVEVEIEGEYLLLRRTVLDALLAEEAAGRGAVVCHGRVVALERRADAPVAATFAGSHRTVRARIAIVATGASTLPARRLALPCPPPSAVGLRGYVRSAASLDRLVTFYDPASLPSYGWLFPLGRGEYNVGYLAFRGDRRGPADPRRALRRLVEALPHAREVIRRGELVGPLRGARVRCGLRGLPPLAEGKVLAVGETIGSTLPLTGEGVGPAMETGELAAAVVHDALATDDLTRLREYPRRVETELWPRHLSYLVAQRCAASRWLNDFLARRVRRGAVLHPLAARVADEETRAPSVALLHGVFRLAAKLRRPPGR